MKKFLIGLTIVLGASLAAVALIAARFEPKIAPNTVVGPIPVGGLTKDEAARRIRLWWESEKSRELRLVNPLLTVPMPPMTAAELGMKVDDEGSVRDLPTQDLVEVASAALGSETTPTVARLRFTGPDSAGIAKVRALVAVRSPRSRPAQVKWTAEGIVRQPEASGLTVGDALAQPIEKALLEGSEVELPLVQAPKVVTDEALARIRDVMSEFATRFPAYQTSRNTNIRLASDRLNGLILLPGKEVSFNTTVGRRTVKDGFRMAPVLKNGKHDVDIGGGICQVSSTLYNAALYANLAIKRRHNHSIPSAYVPVGRDATVDYGNLDLVISNPYDHPIAITSQYKAGQLIFRILGERDPSLKVKLVTTDHRSWPRGEKIVQDPTLKPGSRKVIEKGSAGHSIRTYRVIYRDGVEVKREALGRSHYAGMDKIIAVNPPKPPEPKPDPPATDGF